MERNSVIVVQLCKNSAKPPCTLLNAFDTCTITPSVINPVNKQRVTINQPLRESLFALFWALKRIGYGQKQQVDLVYDLFVMFKVDDYGKGLKDYDSPKGELSEAEVNQHERIRKQFQQPAIKSRDQYAEIFGWDA